MSNLVETRNILIAFKEQTHKTQSSTSETSVQETPFNTVNTSLNLFNEISMKI